MENPEVQFFARQTPTLAHGPPHVTVDCGIYKSYIAILNEVGRGNTGFREATEQRSQPLDGARVGGPLSGARVGRKLGGVS
jgi:hypothetical protein